MNELGVSSACFYPLETEASLRKITDYRFPLCELFFNAPSELEADFVEGLRAHAAAHDLRVVSVHPFTSFTESFFLFSAYERRFIDTLPLYRRYCAVANALGAKILVIHGIKPPYTISEAEYFRRFAVLMEIGAAYGVSVCQENVVRHRSEDPTFLWRMAKALGPDFGIVFDIKQARRANVDHRAFLEAVGDHIAHLHLSDFTPEKDCVPPGEGRFDFPAFFADLRAIGYRGDYVIELYRDSYTSERQIHAAYDYLKKALANQTQA